jgi:integrase
VAWPKNLIELAQREAEPNLRRAIIGALYFGQRRADLVKLNRSHLTHGGLALAQEKTKQRVVVPIHSRAQEEIIDTMEPDQMTLLTTRKKQAWRPNHLTHSVTNLVRSLGFHGYCLHGLRKNAANNLFEAGCSSKEVQAIVGHRTLTMVEKYGREAERKILGRSAIRKLENYETKNR